MISYHPDKIDTKAAWAYHKGFKIAATDDVKRIAKGICRYVWSPIIWKDGIRAQNNFLSAAWCVLDFDDGMTVKEAKEIFADKIHIIGTTKSHQVAKGDVPACDRFRVFLKFVKPITDLRLYRCNMERLVHEYHSDKACKDGARYFFPCKEIVSCVDFGREVSVNVFVPDSFEKFVPKFSPAYAQAKIIPRWLEKELSVAQPVGIRNNWVFSKSIVLAECGYSKDEIITEILNSATYRGSVSPETLRDIKLAVKNGMKRAICCPKNKPP